MKKLQDSASLMSRSSLRTIFVPDGVGVEGVAGLDAGRFGNVAAVLISGGEVEQIVGKKNETFEKLTLEVTRRVFISMSNSAARAISVQFGACNCLAWTIVVP